MQILTSIHEPSPVEVAVMLGNFDGFHRAHARLAEKTCAYAAEHALTPAAFCLHGMPARGMALFNEQEKLDALERAGISLLFRYDFSALCALHAERFVEDVLLGAMRAKAVFCGYDYRFGQKKSAGVQELSALLQGRAELFVLPAVCDDTGAPISSTAIRSLLQAGDLAGAEALFGHAVPDSVMRQL